MKQAALLVGALGVFVVGSGGCGNSSPATPTPTARAAVSVTISPITVARTPTGYEYGLTVTARETGGVVATLTGLTLTLSSATVPRGTVQVATPFSTTTLPASGSVTSRAITVSEASTDVLAAVRVTAVVAFTDNTGALSASADATISAPPTSFTLSGTVSMSAPSSSTRLVGARVEILDGAHAGTVAVTDGSGAFSFTGIAGGLTARASLAGYQDQSLGATMTMNQALSFGLAPNPRTLDESYTGSISGGTPTTCSDGIFTKPCITIALAVHNAGNLSASLDWNPGSADLDLTLWRGSTLLASSRTANSKETVSSFLSAGSYQLKITYYGGSVIAGYTLRVTRPN